MKMFLIVTTIVFVATTSQAGHVYIVHDSASIQAALDSVVPGDAIVADPGTFFGPLHCDVDSVTITGAGAGLSVIVDTSETPDTAMLTFSSGVTSTTVLSGFTFQGGWMGVLCTNSSPVIRDNAFVGQQCDDWGTGAISLRGCCSGESGPSPATIENNTIVGCPRAGVSSFSTVSPTVKNNIIAYNGYGILREYSNIAQLDLSHNNVYGNDIDYSRTASGTGSISTPPLFTDTSAGDYTLRWGSPCIDSGDPDQQYDDPDGTRGDMGPDSLHFNQLALDLPTPAYVTLGDEEMWHVIDSHPTFHWSPYSRGLVTGYTIQVGSDDDWTEAEMWDTTNLANPPLSAQHAGDPLQDGTLYWYRVRLYELPDTGTWYYGVFRMNTAPAAAQPRHPLQYSSPNFLRMVVESAEDPEDPGLFYDFELYEDTSGQPLVADTGVFSYGGLAQSSDYIQILEADASYWWHSRVTDGFEHSPWSGWQSFTTVNDIVLDSVVGQLPEVDSIPCGQLVTLRLRISNHLGAGLAGVYNGFRVYSPEGARWDSLVAEWNPEGGFYHYFTGTFVDTFSMTGSGADTLLFSGMSGFPEYPTGASDVTYLVHLQASCSDTGMSICIDSCTSIPSYEDWTWVWAYSGGLVPPYWVGPRCFGISDCCVGLRGDINLDNKVNIADLTALASYLFGGNNPPTCPEEANVDGDADRYVNIVDLTYMVAYLFGAGAPPAPCP